MGRNFFDPSGAMKIQQHNLQLWPGFIATLRNFDGGLLYCVEVTHKVIRMQNLHDIINGIRQQCRDRNVPMNQIKSQIKTDLVGSIVLTIYNRNTYRVDDIDFVDNSDGGFPQTRNGVTTQISYPDYYEQKYLSDTSPQLRDDIYFCFAANGSTFPF